MKAVSGDGWGKISVVLFSFTRTPPETGCERKSPCLALVTIPTFCPFQTCAGEGKYPSLLPGCGRSCNCSLYLCLTLFPSLFVSFKLAAVAAKTLVKIVGPLCLALFKCLKLLSSPHLALPHSFLQCQAVGLLNVLWLCLLLRVKLQLTGYMLFKCVAEDSKLIPSSIPLNGVP